MIEPVQGNFSNGFVCVYHHENAFILGGYIMSKNVAEYFACDVFNDEVMKGKTSRSRFTRQ